MTRPDQPTPPWAQPRPQAASGRQTERQRKVVESLPDWEPLPPGEILVRRGQHRDD
ncbi:hypothetical protein ACN27F_17670 [Solwaraspora sp. WMMB335]|uniref:hypothetical protein n=1 Tax=Solwaraspora sp. WMMB335 TaxID=3404118 RepID=UPI003B92C547